MLFLADVTHIIVLAQATGTRVLLPFTRLTILIAFPTGTNKIFNYVSAINLYQTSGLRLSSSFSLLSSCMRAIGGSTGKTLGITRSQAPMKGFRLCRVQLVSNRRGLDQSRQDPSDHPFAFLCLVNVQPCTQELFLLFLLSSAVSFVKGNQVAP